MGLYRDNGKENGNYYLGFRVYADYYLGVTGITLGLYWDFIG